MFIFILCLSILPHGRGPLQSTQENDISVFAHVCYYIIDLNFVYDQIGWNLYHILF